MATKQLKLKGIDVSKWQGNIDFKRVKQSGQDFVIIRAGYGQRAKDPYFERNYIGAKFAGLSVGAYWYSYATSIREAEIEAKNCIALLCGKQFDFPIYYDIEEPKQLARGKQFINDIIRKFCQTMESAGYYVGVYMSKSPAETLLDDDVKKNYDLWIAQYNKTCTYKGSYQIWQNSSEGKIDGINGKCDTDVCTFDYPGVIKKKHFNGY